jgi:hypothetical protein
MAPAVSRRPKKHAGGRPSQGLSEVRVEVPMSKAMRDEARRQAKVHNVTLAQLIRMAIEEFGGRYELANEGLELAREELKRDRGEVVDFARQLSEYQKQLNAAAIEIHRLESLSGATDTRLGIETENRTEIEAALRVAVFCKDHHKAGLCAECQLMAEEALDWFGRGDQSRPYEPTAKGK